MVDKDAAAFQSDLLVNTNPDHGFTAAAKLLTECFLGAECLLIFYDVITGS